MNYSHYLTFSRLQWGRCRHKIPMIMQAEELDKLRGVDDPISLEEVEDIYLPLAELLHRHGEVESKRHSIVSDFTGTTEPKVPLVIGVAGSVAAGKSTIARVLQTLLSAWPYERQVAIVTTDGFLHPNHILEQRNLMQRKGFPESYDTHALLQFLIDLKAGKQTLEWPVYSHYHYDILPDARQRMTRPDIVLLEGLNVLQRPEGDGRQLFVSDFVDIGLFVDAPITAMKQWYIHRFMVHRAQATEDKNAYFYRFAQMTEQEASVVAEDIWTDINERNLRENILSSKTYADVVLCKGASHQVEQVHMRKL